MKKYEKPKMIFCDLRLNQGVADTCWGLDGTSKPNGKPGTANYSGPFNYDVSGDGYVSFWVKGTSGCGAPDAFNIYYYGSQTGSQGEPLDGTNVEGTWMETELESALYNAGGSEGNPYSGLTTKFPINPDPSWS